MTTVGQWLKTNQQKLLDAGIESARLDCLILLEDSLSIDRARILAHPKLEIPHSKESDMNTKVIRRINHEPLAYIRGKANFYGRNFDVNNHVLVPRPETEVIIDLLKRTKKRELVKTVIDIGTGSGALAITAKLEFPNASVIATDIDPKALEVARKNATKLGADIKFMQGSLLEPIHHSSFPIDPSFIIMANLPYLPQKLEINKAARHEPKTAIFSGRDGLDHYRLFWKKVKTLKQSPEHILTESLKNQHTTLMSLGEQAGYRGTDTSGLIQQFSLLEE